MKNVPSPPPPTFPVIIRESDPWTPRAPGTPLPVTRLATIQVKFERGLDGRVEAAKKAARDFFSGRRGDPAVNVTDDGCLATFQKPKPAAGAMRPR